jgi:hypothetical protein
MKKVLLAGTALVGAALVASPAQAELKLDLGGHFKGYAVYLDQDTPAAAPGQRDFEFRKNTEIFFSGETTLDNGLTVGVHVEQEIENNNNNNESYAYFSGGWGRVNFGNEDGAAYLLQVAAPSADSNVDGLRPYISSFNTLTAGAGFSLDYQHADFGSGPTDVNGLQTQPTDRLTYLTPKFNGFQAGVSYAPDAALHTGFGNMGAAGFEDAWELAVRWDGQFEGIGLSLGGGYSTADNTVAAGGEPETWNLGANVAWNSFSFGAGWREQQDTFGINNLDTTTWVVGAAWDNGPYHVGASYLDRNDDFGAGVEVDSWRAAVGGGYTFGPGMTFRGTIAWGEEDTGAVSVDATQVTLGTDISF